MKKVIFITIFLVCDLIMYPQTCSAGFSADFLTGNKYLDYEIGPSLKLDYKLKDLPFSITGTARLYLTGLSSENNFAARIYNNFYSIGVSLNYYPLAFSIEPYVGLGAFYNFNNLQRDGNATPSSDGVIRLPEGLKNSVSAELTAGVKFSANTPINFIVEVTQTFNSPKYNLDIQYPYGASNGGIRTQAKTINFNSLLVKIGLMFKI